MVYFLEESAECLTSRNNASLSAGFDMLSARLPISAAVLSDSPNDDGVMPDLR